MSLQQEISISIKEAMKSKEAERLSTLRMLNAELLNYSISQGTRDKELEDQVVITIVSKEIKKRKDAIESYEKGGREELAQKEKTELELLQKFMPEQMSEEEIKKIVQEIVDGGAIEFAKVIGVAMGKLKGKADGSMVRRIIEETLS